MNVLFLNSARRWGGNEKWTIMAAQGLAERGHATYLAYRDPLIGKKAPPNVYNFRLPFVFELDLFTLARLAFIIKNQNIQFLIPTRRKDYVIAAMLGKLLRVKIVPRLGIVREVHHSLLERLIFLRAADAIIVNAQKTKSVLVQNSGVPEHKVFVIYNGVALQAELQKADRLREGLRSFTRKLAKLDFVIGYAGELSARKGCVRLLQHFARLRRRTDAACALCLAGTGDQAGLLEDKARELGIADAVVFTGFLDDPRVILCACHTFALLSANEGIANAMLEAMACGLPVIATDAGGAREAIADGESGFLLDPDDGDRFVEICLDLLHHPDKRRAIGQAARSVVQQKFSHERMMQGLMDCLRQVGR